MPPHFKGLRAQLFQIALFSEHFDHWRVYTEAAASLLLRNQSRQRELCDCTRVRNVRGLLHASKRGWCVRAPTAHSRLRPPRIITSRASLSQY